MRLEYVSLPKNFKDSEEKEGLPLKNGWKKDIRYNNILCRNM